MMLATMGITAYQTNLAAVKKLEEGNLDWLMKNNSGNRNAAGWGKIFLRLYWLRSVVEGTVC